MEENKAKSTKRNNREIAEELLSPCIGKVHPEIYMNMVEALIAELDKAGSGKAAQA